MSSVRKIVFGGLDTLASGIRINSEKSKTSGAGIRMASEEIAYRDGSITYPVGMDSSVLTYNLILSGKNRAEVEAKARYICECFKGKVGDLTDSDFPGKKFLNAVFTGADPLEYVNRNFRTAYLAVSFQADPVLYPIGTVNRRIIKFAASGAAALTITDNSAYTLTRGGTTTTGTYTAAEPYTYRLTAYAEGAHTITLSGAEIQPEEPFTMPSNAEIAISGNGYGFYELWHDTREVRV